MNDVDVMLREAFVGAEGIADFGILGSCRVTYTYRDSLQRVVSVDVHLLTAKSKLHQKDPWWTCILPYLGCGEKVHTELLAASGLPPMDRPPKNLQKQIGQ